MVPIWPFAHLLENESYPLLSPGQFINPEYHKMTEYIKTIKTSDWETLSSFYRREMGDTAVEKWLSSDGFVAFTANTLNLFNKAIGYVIRKVLKATGVVIQMALSNSMTLLDHLAYILDRGLKRQKSFPPGSLN